MTDLTTGDLVRNIRNGLSFVKPLQNLYDTLVEIEKKELNVRALEGNENVLKTRVDSLDRDIKDRREFYIAQEEELRSSLASTKQKCAEENTRLTNELEKFKTQIEEQKTVAYAEYNDLLDQIHVDRVKLEDKMAILKIEHSDLTLKIRGIKEAIGLIKHEDDVVIETDNLNG